MANHLVISKAYFGGRVIEPGETVDWPDGEKLPLWVDDPARTGGLGQVAVPVPAPTKRKPRTISEAKTDILLGGETADEVQPEPVAGADWIKPEN